MVQGNRPAGTTLWCVCLGRRRPKIQTYSAKHSIALHRTTQHTTPYQRLCQHYIKQTLLANRRPTLTRALQIKAVSHRLTAGLEGINSHTRLTAPGRRLRPTVRSRSISFGVLPSNSCHFLSPFRFSASFTSNSGPLPTTAYLFVSSSIWFPQPNGTHPSIYPYLVGALRQHFHSESASDLFCTSPRTSRYSSQAVCPQIDTRYYFNGCLRA